jgi:Hemerythrin HHE cation binding domain
VFDSIKRWVGQEPQSKRAVPRASLPEPALRTPHFDATLLATLRTDHQDLLDRFKQIGRLAELGRVGELPALLTSFKIALQSHLIAKNVRFYNYIENLIADDEDTLRSIRNFRREMNAISGGIMDFVKKYQRYDFDEARRVAMLKDYPAIGGLLVLRIKREESQVFPLYRSN